MGECRSSNGYLNASALTTEPRKGRLSRQNDEGSRPACATPQTPLKRRAVISESAAVGTGSCPGSETPKRRKTSDEFPLLPVCAICAQPDSRRSPRPPELVFCAECETRCAHPFCLGAALNDEGDAAVGRGTRVQWRCPQCRLCVVCNQPEGPHIFYACSACPNGVHKQCIAGQSSPAKGAYIYN